MPLDFAYIKLFQGNLLLTGTQTDLDGNYIFQNIVPGVYDIEASFIGYTSEKKIGIEIKSGKKNLLNFSLPTSGFILEEIVVTALGIKREKKSLGYSTQTITSDNIKNKPTKSVIAFSTNSWCKNKFSFLY